MSRFLKGIVLFVVAEQVLLGWAPSADRFTAVELACVDHIAVWMLAKWTTHGEAVS